MNLIVAADENWAIGNKNELLVRIPADQKFFRETTMGKVVVMGRKTLETFPNGLPLMGRTNIVLTHDKKFRVPGTLIVHDMEELHEELEKYNSEDIYVIGGESVYRQLIDECDVAHVTKIDFAYDADAHFPDLDADPEWKSLFDETSLDFNTVDGKIYGIPVSKEVSYIYYNKDLFEQAGIEAPEVAYATWDEFFEACDKLKEAGITPIGMDSADSGWLTNLWMSALIGTNGDAGNEWMNTMYPTDYNTPEVIEAAENIQKMFQNYTTPDAVGGKYDPMATHFFNGEVAMFPNGPWMIPDFSEAPEGFYDKVGIMLLPGNGMEMVPTPGDMVGATDPEKIEAAVAFLKFETTPENQIKALEMTGLQPVSDNLEVPDTLSESDPLMAQTLEIQGKAEVTYGQNQAYWYQNTIDTFSTELPELAYGNITAEEFCTKLSEAAAKNVE